LPLKRALDLSNARLVLSPLLRALGGNHRVE
jgi:hypothetical protein